MAGKKDKAKKQVKKDQRLKEKPETDSPSQAIHESENTFEFDGLPERNLKKNLGCG